MDIKELIKDIDKKRLQELALLDCLASALTVNAIFKDGGIDFSSITPEMGEAFHLQYPNLELSDLENYSEEQFLGIVNGWKGKLFEVNLRNGLNEGNDIGGIHLDHGQVAELVKNPTNEGFDLIITDHSGHVVDEIQAKATDSISYIHETIEKYPDYDIIATEESANLLGSNFDSVAEINGVDIHNSLMSNEDLTSKIENVFPDDDFHIEGFSFLLVPLVRNGHRYLVGKYTVEKAVSTFVEDSGRSAIAIAGGSMLALIGMGTGVGIVAAFVIRMAIGNNKSWGDLDRYDKIDDGKIWGDLDRYKGIKDSNIW